ncbi:hypothetical protein BLNAU_4079 [Blattamonas nauphoetae]|uniref:Uncharacterized protein n=1 Tax=Blattamonas nauphoetae TaxID=2049346 RepID=A0ABQ9YB40_9EUKA|nr:hypothetical protein BLNAU_4079 [Blattamonas nauphoetae]
MTFENRIYHSPRDRLQLKTRCNPCPSIYCLLGLCAVGGGVYAMARFDMWYLSAAVFTPLVFVLAFINILITHLTTTTITLDPVNDEFTFRVTPSLFSRLFCKKETFSREKLHDITMVSFTTKHSHVSNRRNPYDEDGRLLVDPRNGKKTHARMKCRLHTTIQKYICSQYLSFEELQVLVDFVHEYRGWAMQNGLVNPLLVPANFRELLAQRAEPAAELPNRMNAQAPYMAGSDSAELNSLYSYRPPLPSQSDSYAPASLPPYAYAPAPATGQPDVTTSYPADPPSSLPLKDEDEPDVF